MPIATQVILIIGFVNTDVKPCPLFGLLSQPRNLWTGFPFPQKFRFAVTFGDPRFEIKKEEIKMEAIIESCLG